MRTSGEAQVDEEKIGPIGQEIVDGVPLGGTAMAALMAPSPAEKRPSKNCLAQHIECGITTTETVSSLAYWT